MNPIDSHIEQAPADIALGLTHTLREAARHGERAVLLCSFQKEESVLIDELLRLDQGTADAVRIVTIDTGVLFEETLQTWKLFEERFGVKVEVDGREQPGQAPGPARALLRAAKVDGPGTGARAAPRAGSRASAASRDRRGRAPQADRTRRAPGPVEVQPARPLDREGPVAATSTSASCPTTRSTTRATPRSGARLHPARQRPRGSLGGRPRRPSAGCTM